MAADLLIKNGLIADGSGGKPFKGSVAVKHGSIASVGTGSESASRVIDADGLCVAPGFWDVHTHYDAQLLWDPIATSSCWHGVTTVVMGNCGFTVAPCQPKDQDWMVRMLARVEGMSVDVLRRTLPWPWEDFGGYLDTLDKALGVNAIAQVGHTAIRRYVMGEESAEREATESEVEHMRQVLAESLRAGGMGFTSSRIVTHWDGDGLPVPSRLASLDEYFTLVRELRAIKAGWVQSASPEFNRHKLAEVAEASGRTVCWNAIAQRPDRPEAWRGQLDRLRSMRSEGIPFFALAHTQPTDFEFTFEATNMFDRWPTSQMLMIEPREQRIAHMKDEGMRARMREEMKVDPIPNVPHDWDRTVVVKSPTRKFRDFESQDLQSIGEKLGKHPLDVAFDMALEEDLKTQFRILDPRDQDPDVMLEILKADHVVPGMSDAGAHLLSEVNTGFATRLLGHWVREKQGLSLEHAIQLLSSRPAEEAGVTDRGRISEGMAADITIFDPETVAASERSFVSDLPGGQRRLVQHSRGIEYTVVNGQVTLEHGKHTGALGGKTLRSTSYG